MKIIILILYFITIVSSQIPSVEWGEMLNERCNDKYGNSEECLQLQQRYESEIERIVILVETKTHISPPNSLIH